MVLTRVQGRVEGDVVFDLGLLADWREKLVKEYAAEGGNSMPFRLLSWSRRKLSNNSGMVTGETICVAETYTVNSLPDI